MAKAKNGLMSEYGKIGMKQYGGVFFEEFLPQLQGQKGIEAFKEMEENDDIIGAVMFAIKMLIRQVQWDVEPKGANKADRGAAEFIKTCFDDISPNMQNTISEILSFLPYGFSFFEICYKRRMGKNKSNLLSSRYDDGLIGWRGFMPRSQDTLLRWEYDDNDELTGMTQIVPPSFEERTIPIEKALHFVTESRKGNPNGRSILRNSYRLWYFKKRMQEIEGIGVERDLVGLPVLTAPEGVDIWDVEDTDMANMLAIAENLVQNIRRDQKEGIVLPNGWKLELLNGGSKRQFDTGQIIERYDTRIAMTCLADFVLLGHQQVGSFALSSDKTRLFSVALGTYLDIITEQFNKIAIPKLIDLNAAKFNGITEYPELVHSDLEEQDISQLSAFIKDMASVGAITLGPEIEAHLRRAARLPEAVEGAEYPKYPDEQEEEEKQGEPQKPKVNANTEEKQGRGKVEE